MTRSDRVPDDVDAELQERVERFVATENPDTAVEVVAQLADHGLDPADQEWIEPLLEGGEPVDSPEQSAGENPSAEKSKRGNTGDSDGAASDAGAVDAGSIDDNEGVRQFCITRSRFNDSSKNCWNSRPVTSSRLTGLTR